MANKEYFFHGIFLAFVWGIIAQILGDCNQKDPSDEGAVSQTG